MTEIYRVKQYDDLVIDHMHQSLNEAYYYYERHHGGCEVPYFSIDTILVKAEVMRNATGYLAFDIWNFQEITDVTPEDIEWVIKNVIPHWRFDYPEALLGYLYIWEI